MLLPSCLRRRAALSLVVGLALGVTVTSCGKPQATAAEFTPLEPGLEYRHDRISRGPWSIHVLRIDRSRPDLELQSAHANGTVLGLGTVSEQLETLDPKQGRPVAAVSGDFYQRDRAFAGDPRGLQILRGDLLSAPVGGAGLWVDAAGQLHAANIQSALRITWPNGTKTPFTLNGERQAEDLELYTPLLGGSTHASGGKEWVLEPTQPLPGVALPPGTNFNAIVREVRTGISAPVKPGTLVLSAGPALAPRLPQITAGSTVQVSTVTSPNLPGARTAISGGPLLVHEGQAQEIRPPNEDSYQFSSMVERHPRSAVGWNPQFLYLVAVDGRQPGAAGMTLTELGKYLATLGCQEALNLDGGGSATLWAAGKVRNRPSDGRERELASSLVVVRRTAP
jgi:hypothetical protein